MKPNDVILMHGGGNFGDLYRFSHNIRLRILEMYASRRVVFLPQTINYQNFSRFKATDVRTFSLNKNLTMTFRSNESYLFARKNFPLTHSLLMPDVAFMLGNLRNRSPPPSSSSHSSLIKYDVLILRRWDDESKFAVRLWTRAYVEHFRFRFSYLDVDWFSYEEEKQLNASSHDYLEQMSAQREQLIHRIMSQSRVVITDRLHASIYSLLIGKPLVVVDEKYKKIFNTLETAFHGKKECDKQFLSYSYATDPMDAVRQAVSALEFLKKQK